jgi:hypothetical protein
LRRRNACRRRGPSALTPRKTPPGRRHPVRAASRPAGRANSASLYRMAPVRPHGGRQVGTQVTITARPAFPAETPFDAARIAHDALDTASAAQHFQLADMGMDVNLGVAADPSYPGAGGFKIRAGAIDAGIIRHVTDIGIPCLPEANVTRSNLSGRAARNQRYRRQSPPILRPGSVRATSVGQHALRRS